MQYITLEKTHKESFMNVTVNGKEKTIADGNISVVELLSKEKVETPDMVSVQLNGKILKRDFFENTQLNDGDQVEFLYFMGGGAGRD